ncbi:putative serine/threonine protein kinase [Apodospora peruviana]|uniref:non-specific serine/threonine protein kinase n=1 Tax=Apodospora peruviana TaxID=516989 RepID=A0AAE0IKT6_9PEZI|nr:putative serine/threonine protein kinase [Apodospora peruviana]
MSATTGRQGRLARSVCLTAFVFLLSGPLLLVWIHSSYNKESTLTLLPGVLGGLVGQKCAVPSLTLLVAWLGQKQPKLIMENNSAPRGPAETPQRGDPLTRELPTAEAEVYGDDVLLEEETLPWFDPRKWYPVRLGEVIISRYQVLVKLGFGSVSTVWLCRDLRKHTFVALKVYEPGHRQAANETLVFDHLKSVAKIAEHRDRKLIRALLHSFQIDGPVGQHVYLVYEPLCMSLEDVRLVADGQLPINVMTSFIHFILRGLIYLHEVAKVVHTVDKVELTRFPPLDIQAGNFMLGTDATGVWDELVQEEWGDPAPRKVTQTGNYIYGPRSPDIPDDGIPIICDLGDAHFGDGPFTTEVMPDLFRAPEIILHIPSTEKIDIWGFGTHAEKPAEGFHIARMVSLLGNPPKDLLSRSKDSPDFFDEDGNLFTGRKDLDNSEITDYRSLEEGAKVLQGGEKNMFLAFIRKMLQWRPEDRPTARELMNDPWLDLDTLINKDSSDLE